jgi:hypothetical protein
VPGLHLADGGEEFPVEIAAGGGIGECSLSRPVGVQDRGRYARLGGTFRKGVIRLFEAGVASGRGDEDWTVIAEVSTTD